MAPYDGWSARPPRRTSRWDFEISGSGRMIGVGNGDTNSHEPEVFLSSVPRSIKVGDWRWKLADVPENGGALPEYAKDFDDSSWEALKLGDANTIKKEHATAIFLMEELAVNQQHGFFVSHDLAVYEVPVHADIPIRR